jgi:hypothetical protein
MRGYWDKDAGLVRLRCDRPEGHSEKDEKAFKGLKPVFSHRDFLDSLLGTGENSG